MNNFNPFKLYEYEISFHVDKKITKKKLTDYLLKENSIVKDIQISLKKPKSYRTFRLKKEQKNILYKKLDKKYICTLYISATPYILEKVIYNLKIQKISNNIMAIKHLKQI